MATLVECVSFFNEGKVLQTEISPPVFTLLLNYRAYSLRKNTAASKSLFVRVCPSSRQNRYLHVRVISDKDVTIFLYSINKPHHIYFTTPTGLKLFETEEIGLATSEHVPLDMCAQQRFSICAVSLRKHAYSNILKILQTKKKKKKKKRKRKKFRYKKIWYFSYSCSKHRLWVLIRTASTRRF